MIGDETPAEEERQERIAKLKADLTRLRFARDAFDAQADYADQQVKLHNRHIKALEQELKEI